MLLSFSTSTYRADTAVDNLGHPLRSLLGKQLFPGLGLGLRLGAHDATSPLLPHLIEFVVEVGLHGTFSESAHQGMHNYMVSRIYCNICHIFTP